jgi:YaiO family outer membrane protein
MRPFICILIFQICFFSFRIYAQESKSPDDLFQDARTTAFSNHYSEARTLCYQILKTNPNYLDAQILIGRTFSWDKQYDSARYHFRDVLHKNAYALDGYLALADAEIWSGHCQEALNLCDSALLKIPHNYDLLLKRTKACLCKEDIACAKATIDSLLKVYPLNLEIQDLINQTHRGNFKNRLIVEHLFDFFQKPYVRRWHVTSFQYERDDKWGTAIGKVNVGQLIQSSGKLYNPGAVQYEIDAYPLLGKGYYAYLNYGFSDGDLFPQHRTGLELFKTFSQGTEISLGGRYLHYKNGINVWIYTGSLSQYTGNWWFSVRPYFADIQGKWSQSYFLFARHYTTQYNYLGGMVGYGVSPDEQINSLGFYETYNLKSYQVRFDLQHRLGNHFLFRSLAGYAYEEYKSAIYRNRFNIQLYLAYLF